MAKKKNIVTVFEPKGMNVLTGAGCYIGEIKLDEDWEDEGLYVFEAENIPYSAEELEVVVAKLKELNK
jgi:hypothetical protein